MRADALRRRNAIITTAARLFQEHGSSVSLERIAAEAGVGIATLYRNFADKDALVRACSAHLGEEFLAFQEELIASFTAADAAHAAHAAGGSRHVRAYADKLLTMGLGVLIPAFVPADLDSLSPELQDLRRKLLANGEEFIRLGQIHGEIGPGVTHLEFIVGLLALVRPRAVRVETFEPDIDTRMVDLYLAGIKAGHNDA